MSKHTKEEIEAARARVNAAVSIDPAAATDPMLIRRYYTELPSQIAYWTERAAEAHEVYLRAMTQAEVLEANLYIRHKNDLTLMDGKATEAAVRARVVTSQPWIDGQNEVSESDAKRRKLNGIVDALHAKKDSLVSLGAFLRKEFAG